MAEALLRLGTRGSKLALTQTGLVRDALAKAHAELAAPGAIEIVVIRTTGDMIQDRPLSEAGGKGLFVKEIEEALLTNRIDAAVHSMKDMPTAQPDGLAISAFLPREDARDVLIAGDGIRRIADLRQGAVVGGDPGAAGGQRRRFGHAHELQGQVAIGFFAHRLPPGKVGGAGAARRGGRDR